MIRIRMTDAEGHGYWLYDDGQFVLALKEKPAVGIQFRTIAWLKKGVFSFRHLYWHKEHKCWYPSRFPMLKTQAFGIKIGYVQETVDGEEFKGFVHPRVLTKRNVIRHSTGYEAQLKLLPKDLKKTREEAVEVWKEL